MKQPLICLDKIKKLGFYYSTVGGISFSMNDLVVPEKKMSIIKKAEKEVHKVEKTLYGWCYYQW